jgi:hypothetical protein
MGDPCTSPLIRDIVAALVAVTSCFGLLLISKKSSAQIDAL